MADQIRVLTTRSTRRRVAGFHIAGTVEGGVWVAARYVDGTLHCDDALRRRAELVVAAGDTFELAHSSRHHVATLDGDPVAVALTLIRAMHVDTFELDLDDITIRRCGVEHDT